MGRSRKLKKIQKANQAKTMARQEKQNMSEAMKILRHKGLARPVAVVNVNKQNTNTAVEFTNTHRKK